MLCACCLSASSLEIWTGFFFLSQLPCGQPYKFHFEANPIWYSAIKFTKSHSAKCSLRKWAWLFAASKWACLNCTNLTHFHLTGLTVGRFRGNSCIVIFGLFVSCYSLLQHSRLAWLELFVDYTHTYSMNNLRWQPHWLPRLTSLPRKSRDWWRTRDSSLGQPTENKID